MYLQQLMQLCVSKCVKLQLCQPDWEWPDLLCDRIKIMLVLCIVFFFFFCTNGVYKCLGI